MAAPARKKIHVLCVYMAEGNHFFPSMAESAVTGGSIFQAIRSKTSIKSSDKKTGKHQHQGENSNRG